MPKRGEVRQFELRTLKKRPSMGSRPHCFFLKASNISAKEKNEGGAFKETDIDIIHTTTGVYD